MWGNWFNGGDLRSGPWTQVSRLGNPLANELLIGIGAKDVWNTQPPTTDGTEFLNYFAKPLLPQLLPSLYPGVFPNLATYNGGVSNTRPDIEAIFLTGIPAGVITQAPTFTNYNGTGIKADMLRLNTAIPPSSSPNSLGLLGLDVAGFPNGRRVFDDVATIALRAVAGATLGYVVPSFTRRRGRRPGRLRAHERWHRPLGQGHRGLPPCLPVSGDAVQRLQEPRRDAGLGGTVVMDHLTGTSEVGSVVLDIGGDLGAAIVHTPAALAGLEIEIRREGAPWDGTHVAVRARRVPGGEVHAALFPGLPQGGYEVRVRGDDNGIVAAVAVEGARVSETRLERRGLVRPSPAQAAWDYRAIAVEVPVVHDRGKPLRLMVGSGVAGDGEAADRALATILVAVEQVDEEEVVAGERSFDPRPVGVVAGPYGRLPKAQIVGGRIEVPGLGRKLPDPDGLICGWASISSRSHSG